MIIHFKTTKLKKEFEQHKLLQRKHGPRRAKLIQLRMVELRAAETLADLWPPLSGPARCHELTEGNRAGQLSVDLDHPYRLLFRPEHTPIPKRPEGGLDWSGVTAIKILGVEDTHG